MKLKKYLAEDHIEKFGDTDEDIKFLQKYGKYKYLKIKCCSTCNFSEIKDDIVYCRNKDFVQDIESNVTAEMAGIVTKDGGILVHIFGYCPRYRED